MVKVCRGLCRDPAAIQLCGFHYYLEQPSLAVFMLYFLTKEGEGGEDLWGVFEVVFGCLTSSMGIEVCLGPEEWKDPSPAEGTLSSDSRSAESQSVVSGERVKFLLSW